MASDLKLLAGLVCCLTFTGLANADQIVLQSGHTVEGVVIKTNDADVLVLADYGTTTLPSKLVKEIKPDKKKRPTTLSVNSAVTENRIPEWKRIVEKLAEQGWSRDLKQIPATVITNGIMRNVPYISFRCGTDYEMNIYGDLDNPAALEIGFFRDLLSTSYAKDNSIEFMTGCLLEEDGETIKKLNKEKDLIRRNDWTFEVTPPTAEDSYGGWWLSFYNEKALDEARVTDKELQAISILNSQVIKETNTIAAAKSEGSREQPTPSWTKNDLQYARPVYYVVGPAPKPVSTPTVQSPPPSPTPSYSYSSTASEHSYDHGSVYVRGYYRKNGTYVHSYTRRR